MPSLKIDLVTHDSVNDEFVLYFVENGPWIEPIEPRLREIEDRLYDSFDAIVDGHVAKKFPQSEGKNIRLQVDSYDSAPESVLELVRKFAQHLQSDADVLETIGCSIFVGALRAVNGADFGLMRQP